MREAVVREGERRGVGEWSGNLGYISGIILYVGSLGIKGMGYWKWK